MQERPYRTEAIETRRVSLDETVRNWDDPIVANTVASFRNSIVDIFRYSDMSERHKGARDYSIYVLNFMKASEEMAKGARLDMDRKGKQLIPEAFWALVTHEERQSDDDPDPNETAAHLLRKAEEEMVSLCAHYLAHKEKAPVEVTFSGAYFVTDFDGMFSVDKEAPASDAPEMVRAPVVAVSAKPLNVEEVEIEWMEIPYLDQFGEGEPFVSKLRGLVDLETGALYGLSLVEEGDRNGMDDTMLYRSEVNIYHPDSGANVKRLSVSYYNDEKRMVPMPRIDKERVVAAINEKGGAPRQKLYQTVENRQQTNMTAVAQQKRKRMKM